MREREWVVEELNDLRVGRQGQTVSCLRLVRRGRNRCSLGLAVRMGMARPLVPTSFHCHAGPPRSYGMAWPSVTVAAGMASDSPPVTSVQSAAPGRR
jgi:hypothetical protein